MIRSIIISMVCLFGVRLTVNAQIVISGNVRNSVTQEVVPVVSVTMKEAQNGDYTNDQGNFKFSTRKNYPVTLILSSVGFETKEIIISGPGFQRIELSPASVLGKEVVVSASRFMYKRK